MKTMNNQINFFQDRGVSGTDYSNMRIKDAGGKSLVFNKCIFNYSVLERCYLHKAEFINCSFIGVRFVSCNFRSAKFINCTFTYSTFDKTIISENEVIQNAPYPPNQKRDLIQTLRVNAISVGNQEAINDLLSRELQASTQHHLNVWKSEMLYYKNKYNWMDRLRSLFKYIALQTENILWGYGMSPFRVFLWLTIIILLSGVGFAINELQELTINAHFGRNIISGIKHSFLGILDLALVNNDVLVKYQYLFAFLVGVRTTILALFITVLYRRYAR
jgi:hypothetical protein